MTKHELIIYAKQKDPPLASLILAEMVTNLSVSVQWCDETYINVNGIKLNTDASICRYISRLSPSSKLYGSTLTESVEVDHWISFGIGKLEQTVDLFDSFNYLNSELVTVTYLVGHSITIADVFLWSVLYRNQKCKDLLKKHPKFKNVIRWYLFIESQSNVKKILKQVMNTELFTENLEQIPPKTVKRKAEGKFIELPEAEMGKVVVRFPPEASGYLHIGHAKAALLNQYYRDAFKGKLIMRFDDTNPAKEKIDFEKVILEDLILLKINYDVFSHTSDYFDVMLEYCEKLIVDGKAYVDDTNAELMKQEREQKIESKNRNNNVHKNLAMWSEMKKGSPYGQECCVRAKIDMSSVNGCMRDPTIYRCKNEPHPRTGSKYKVYPTYDFACPIVDSLEGVTHCLRTTEYHDRDDQFYWFIDELGLRKPYIWEYSRLNMTNTVLSKRKLTWFVDEGLVDGWDDPRLPTVRGIIRRGLTVEALKEFIVAQGSSRSVVLMQWDKIWAINKKIIDPIVPRYTSVENDRRVTVNIKNAEEHSDKVKLHPKNSSAGEKTVWKGPRIFIDQTDAVLMTEGQTVTFVSWGNIKIVKINRFQGHVVDIDAELNLSDTNYKDTMKVTWIADRPDVMPIVCVYFDHIISKANLTKDEDFKDYVNSSTRNEVFMIGEPELRNIKKSEIIQLVRKGFFICDSPYAPCSPYTSCESPLILFNIPDGHTKESSTSEPVKKELSKKDVPVSKENIVVKKFSPVELNKRFKDITGDEFLNENELNSSVSGKNYEEKLYDSVSKQANKVRESKTNKSDKKLISDQVSSLLSLKQLYKEYTGKDWSAQQAKGDLPRQTPSSSAEMSNTEEQKSKGSSLLELIDVQGNNVRNLKASKAEKSVIDAEVKKLLALKADYKSLTGEDWKPPVKSVSLTKTDSPAPPSKIKNTDGSASALSEAITQQGNRVRSLKAAKEAKAVIDEEVKKLLALKVEYKTATGQDWKPSSVTAPEVAPIKSSLKNVAPKDLQPSSVENRETASSAEKLSEAITEQGNRVRTLKAAKEAKTVIDEEVKKLLVLKAEYKTLTNQDWKPPTESTPPAKNSSSTTKSPAQPAKSKPAKVQEPQGASKKQTRLGLEAKKEENLPDWYSQVITKGELIEYYDVSGCYILRPWAYSIWEAIQSWFDSQIKELGVQNCYFPIFVSKNALEKEKTHIADFSPEVAWVTKSGDSDLAEPIAIRPTSETVMYPAYAKWVQSHRDLPIKLNQWNNVVRWEFKHPQPFLRTREFLWQEGHTAFATQKEAEEEVFVILDLYARIYTDLLAIPVIKGRKTEKEKFAGGDFTTTVEAFIAASGRGIQGATSHHLGQNFSKMFNITFEDPETLDKTFVYQNSWGLTTRTIGVMIMVHSDNQGLVLPPKVAAVQAVIVPCGVGASTKDEDRKLLYDSCYELEDELKSAGIKVKGDYRDNYSPGWKFNHWELKGVPIRIELGPKDIKERQLVAVRRDLGTKITLKRDHAADCIKNMLNEIHNYLYEKAKSEFDSHTITCHEWQEFTPTLDKKNVILAPFCMEPSCEDLIKQDSARDENAEPGALSSGAKSLCIPFEQPNGGVKDGTKCIHPSCNNLAKYYTLFGRSY